MKIRGDAQAIIGECLIHYPQARAAVDFAREATQRCKGEISDFQAVALFVLTHRYNKPGCRILEIGTAYGFSAAIMAQAAPEAKIITLNPQQWEVDKAEFDLWAVGLDNVEFLPMRSTDYLATHTGENFDMVFVDGDHKRVVEDFPFFNKLNPHGLMLFHDYSPKGSWRACPPVYEALNEKRDNFRGFDVLIEDLDGVGMAGWYRGENETW